MKTPDRGLLLYTNRGLVFYECNMNTNDMISPHGFKLVLVLVTVRLEAYIQKLGRLLTEIGN